MSWKKHFQSSSAARKYQKLAARYADDSMMAGSPNSYSSRFASWLPEVYSGQPNRIERYSQYDNMDLDTEINMALDTIADSSTQTNNESSIPFGFEWEDGATGEDIAVLKEMLHQWTSINELDRRIHKVFRSIIKYGDQFFIRDPETYKLFWVAPDKVDSVIVDEGKGKEPEQYVIRDLDANLQTLVASGNLKRPADTRGYSSGPLASGQFQGGAQYGGAGAGGSRFNKNMNVGGTAGLAFYVNADNVVHLSLSEGLDNVWPFGISILENIFKTFKQKELIEDAIIIYRVQRAPERRIFYIDTGRLPNHRAMAYLERIKNEIQQKRIPSRTGGQGNVIDATYNPMSMLEDYFFAQNCISLKTFIHLLDGRSLSLEELIKEYCEGKENWVYSINQKTYKMEPGKITWAGVTRKNAQVVRVTLDNGETVTTTPDHRFIMRDGSEVEAQDLRVDDSLMPLYLKTAKTDKIQHAKKYMRYINNDTGKVKWVHLTVCPKIKENTVIHHIDFNSKNNNPTNLIEMDIDEHTELHKQVGTYSLNKQWNDPEGRKNLIEGMRKLYDEGDEEFYERLSERNRKNAESSWKRNRKRNLNQLQDAREIMVEENTVRYNNILFNRFMEIFIENNMLIKNITEMSDILSNDNMFMFEYHSVNANRTAESRIQGFDENRITDLCRYMGFGGYTDFKNQISIRLTGKKYNHMTAKRQLEYTQPMFDRLVSLQVRFSDLKLNDWMEEIKDDEYLIELFENKNCGKYYRTTTFNIKRVNKLCKWAGYKSVQDFRSNYAENHKIISVEWLEEREDTGDLTIESANGNHTFAIATGIYIHNSEGKGSRVETLPGGDQLGQIDDLKYFLHKLRTGLRVPRSYMPDFDDGGGAIFNDGRVGTAYIEELRFTNYCERLQNLIVPHFDLEFKLFCKHRGVNIHSSLFKLKFHKPQNFSRYRQTEVDGAVLGVYSQVAEIGHISRRFGLMKYAGWTEEEVLENERMWAEENSEKLKAAKAEETVQMGDEVSGFGDVGATAAGLEPGEEPTEEEEEEIPGEAGTESPISGAENAEEEEIDTEEL